MKLNECGRALLLQYLDVMIACGPLSLTAFAYIFPDKLDVLAAPLFVSEARKEKD